MIKLIIVEDERIIRNGIEKHVPWETLGVSEVRTAENADDAFLICRDYRPDIIISDIRMPGMNGIELCTKFREQLPDSQIIFISGFSDKEYLMAGISLGAIKYVEKPIDILELSEAVKKAVQSVRNLRRQNANVLHSLLCPYEVDSESVTRAMHLLEQNRKLEHDTLFYICLLESKNEISDVIAFGNNCKDQLKDELFGENVHFLAEYLRDNMIAILISTDLSGFDGDVEGPESVMVREKICHVILSVKNADEDWFLGVGSQVSSLKELSKSYKSALEALKSLSYKDWNNFAFSTETKQEYQSVISEEESNRFHKLLLDHKEKEAVLFLSEIGKTLFENNAVLNFYVRNTYFVLDNIITQVDKTMHLSGLEQEEITNARFLDQAKTIHEMQEYVLHHIKEVLEESAEEQKNNYLIKKVIEYINQNLENKDLSIQLLADEVFLTPTYLSSLFKKKTGMTIGQYLTTARIKKAEKLLKDPQLKMYHIAELVGYDDANYFAKIFKKKTGMLPSEYRELR